MVSFAARSAARTASSTERRSTSGMESTGARTLLPSTRNSGQIRSSVVSAFLSTRRRLHSARRLRRGRIAKSSRSAGFSASTGARRFLSSGRPNLIAINALRGRQAMLASPPFTPSTPAPPQPQMGHGRPFSGSVDGLPRRLYRSRWDERASAEKADPSERHARARPRRQGAERRRVVDGVPGPVFALDGGGVAGQRPLSLGPGVRRRRRAGRRFFGAFGGVAVGDGLFRRARSGRRGRAVARGGLGRGGVAQFGRIDGRGRRVLSQRLRRQHFYRSHRADAARRLSVAGDRFGARASGVTGIRDQGSGNREQGSVIRYQKSE